MPLKGATVTLTSGPRRLDPIATPGIESVEEQGAPLAVGAALALGVEPSRDEDLDYDGAEDEDGDADDDEAPALREGAQPAPLAAVLAPRPPAMLRFDADAWSSPVLVSPAGERASHLVVRRRLYDHGTLVQSSRSLGPLAPPQQLHLAPAEIDSFAPCLAMRSR